MLKSDDSPISLPKVELLPSDIQTASRLVWLSKARKEQIPPTTNWQTWLIQSGRGWGKTRTGAEWIVWQALQAKKIRLAVVARTSADIRDTCFEGESGIISIIKRYGIYDDKAYNRTNSSYVFPNGSRIKGFSAEEPDRLRGPQHHYAWCDELAAWEKPDTWDQLLFGLRLGEHPQIVVTTTPRPTKLIRELIAKDTTYVTRGSTFDNAENLSPSALAEMQLRYGGTRLGRQELYGEILDDNPGALWTRAIIESARVKLDDVPPLTRIVVGVDPAVTSGEDSDLTGILTCGVSNDGHYYVLSDDTIKATPELWAQKAVSAYELYKADRIVAEVNNGGDLVLSVMRQVKPNIPVKKISSSRGKDLRAEPISALYEQGRVHHVGYFVDLENQMCEWNKSDKTAKSPDRIDALVFALTELSEGSNALNFLSALAVFCKTCQTPNTRHAKTCISCNQPLGA